MKNNYWTATENDLVREFHYCYTATTSATTRQRIFNTLIPKFEYMIDMALRMKMTGYSDEDREEAKQDALLKIWTVLNDKYDKDKAQTDEHEPESSAILNFLWVVVNNILVVVVRQHNKRKADIRYDSEMCYGYKGMIEEEQEDTDTDNVRAEIYAEIDRKILQQHKMNRMNTLYLILLKEYLIENDCNSKGFQDYICKKLKINKRNFYQINYKLKIRSSVFNNKEW